MATSSWPAAPDNFDVDHTGETGNAVPTIDKALAALNALQGTLGSLPQGDDDTVADRLAAISAVADAAQTLAEAVESSNAGKAADSAVVHNTGAESVAGVKTFASSPIVPDPTTAMQAANRQYVLANAPTVADADASTKGKVQLAGDLSGTAAAPTVPGKAPLLVPTAVKTAAYTAAARDSIPVDTTAGAVTVTLPTAPADKTQVAVKRVAGDYGLTVAAGGSDAFDYTAALPDAVTAGMSPTSFWKFLETSGTAAADAGSGANPGVYTGGVTLNQTGIGDAEPAASFDGVNDYVAVPTDADLQPAQVTAAAWVYLTATPTGAGVIVSNSFTTRVGFALGFGISNSTSVPQFSSYDGSWRAAISSQGALSLNEWHHLAGTYDGTTLKIYVDGVLTGTFAFAGPLQYNATEFRIGRSHASVFLTGKIAKPSVHPAARTAAEIDAMFMAQANLVAITARSLKHGEGTTYQYAADRGLWYERATVAPFVTLDSRLALGIKVEKYGASPSASRAVNTRAFRKAFAEAGAVALLQRPTVMGGAGIFNLIGRIEVPARVNIEFPGAGQCELNFALNTNDGCLMGGKDGGQSYYTHWRGFRVKCADPGQCPAAKLDISNFVDVQNYINTPLGTVIGLSPGRFATMFTLEDVDVEGGSTGIALVQCNTTNLNSVRAARARGHCLHIDGVSLSGAANTQSNITIDGRCLFQNVNQSANATSGEEPANVRIGNSTADANAKPHGVLIKAPLFDEPIVAGTVGASNIDIVSARDTTIENVSVNVPVGTSSGNKYGIRIRAGSLRTTLSRVVVEAWLLDASRVPTNTIIIESGATDTVLEDVVTSPNGGGDISDAGTRTVYRNVNKQYSVKSQAGTPVAADFAGIPAGPIRGPIFCTGDSKLYYLMADGTTVKSTAALA